MEVYAEGYVSEWKHLTESSQALALRHEPGKLSALEAAVKVLEETGSPMTAKQLIEAMSNKGYWSSTARAPAHSLANAIQREIHRTGADCLFQQVGRSKFALVQPARSD